MALVRSIEKAAEPSRAKSHTVVDCTYQLGTDEDGNAFLQLDTYGSSQRQIKGKKSQSMRFCGKALEQLVILTKSCLNKT